MIKFIADLGGTLLTSFRIGAAGAATRLKKITGGFAVRNDADSADEELTASKFNASGNTGLVINSDSAGAGADWKITINRPASGMTADYTLTLPVDDGSASQYLQTDGSGNLSWQTVSAGATNIVQTDDTALAFGASSPVAMFTKPANAKLGEVRVYVDTAFDGSTPTLSIGITGTTSKYGSTGQVDLKTVGLYVWDPGVDVVSGTEPIIATYSASASTVGAARIEVDYVVPT